MLGLEPKAKLPAAWKPRSPRNSEKGNNLHKSIDWKKSKLLSEETLPLRYTAALG